MKSIMVTAIAPAEATATATTAAPLEPKKRSKRAREGIMIRTIKVGFDQSAELSGLISRHMNQQRWAFNMTVREKLNDPRVTKFDLDGMLTKWRDAKAWLVHDEDARAAGLPKACNSRVQRAGLRQGLDAVQKFMDSNAKKRSDKIMWKNLAKRDRESEVIPDIDTAVNLPPNKWSNKRNRWSHASDLFRKKGWRQALCVFEKPVPKGNNMVMLPGVGTVRVHGDVEGLDMRSFQLVETTKKTTRRTKDYHRTYRLHIQVGIEAPKPATSDVIRGVDMGIVHGATTVDLDTGRHAFHDIPKGCRRAKNDDISKMYAELSRKRGGSGNRRIRAIRGTGDANDNGNSKSGQAGQGLRTEPRQHEGQARQAQEAQVTQLQGLAEENPEEAREDSQQADQLGEARVQGDGRRRRHGGYGGLEPQKHDRQGQRQGQLGEKGAQPRDGILAPPNVPKADRAILRERGRDSHNGGPQGHQHDMPQMRAQG